jgi:hypothetical protein
VRGETLAKLLIKQQPGQRTDPLPIEKRATSRDFRWPDLAAFALNLPECALLQAFS